MLSRFNHRNAQFDITIKIIDLINIPLVDGQVHIKWRYNSVDYETENENIVDHTVTWNFESATQGSISISKDDTLQDSSIQMNAYQTCWLSGKKEKVKLGHVIINISQFVDVCEAGGDPIIQRYLLQNSKINSTLKISVFVIQVKGDRNFTAPPLSRVQQGISGIAGIIGGDKPDSNDASNEPGTSAETNLIHDLYRTLLYASWFSPAGQPGAEQAVEHVFAGGDGFGLQQLDLEMAKAKLKKDARTEPIAERPEYGHHELADDRQPRTSSDRYPSNNRPSLGSPFSSRTRSVFQPDGRLSGPAGLSGRMSVYGPPFGGSGQTGKPQLQPPAMSSLEFRPPTGQTRPGFLSTGTGPGTVQFGSTSASPPTAAPMSSPLAYRIGVTRSPMQHAVRDQPLIREVNVLADNSSLADTHSDSEDEDESKLDDHSMSSNMSFWQIRPPSASWRRN